MCASDSGEEQGPGAGAAWWEPAGFWEAKSPGLPCPGSVWYWLSPGDAAILGKECQPEQLLLWGFPPPEVVENLPEVVQASWPRRDQKDLLEDHDGNCWVGDWLTQCPHPGFSGD